ncbi:hypothetical protein DYB30_013438 [Aphanomyces astaci]|nr:hypothetical protein DYB34_010428 [Aphanomyces astaci]RHY66044.1 hypothetical protein DYB30_013438 [Aphanomyces astaci]RHY85307.1 hypothetical protein DYB26_008049 [Aphanomyces astaci]
MGQTFEQYALYLSWGSTYFQRALSTMSVFFVCFDVVMNNWEVINYIGNANYLLTPLINIPSPELLAQHFQFPTYANLESLSEVGQFMVSYVLDSSYIRDTTDYVLTAGAHLIDSDTNNICGTLVQTYPLPPLNAPTMRLGVVFNRMQLIRGNTLDTFFTADELPPPPDANHTTLAYLGFIPARMDVDMRLTTSVAIPPPGVTVEANISMYRFAPRSFCSGCNPIVELGLDVCKIVYHVDMASQSLVVSSSTAYWGEYHMLGMILERSSATGASLYLRAIALMVALAGFTTSKKTTRWTEATTMSTFWKRVTHTLAPPLYRYSSHTFTFSNFCLNSDFFVVVYVVAVILDEKNSMCFARLVHTWNIEGDNPWIDIQMMSMQFRWLWINCFVVKAAKVVFNFASLTRYSGSNTVVGFFNFSSVTYIYLGAVFVMKRAQYIEYGNTDRTTLSSTTSDLDGIRIDFFDSWFVRSFPSMMVVMVLNLLLMLGLDRVWNRSMWRRLAQNSLGRQAMFNSSSILCEMCYAFHELDNYKNQAVVVQTRALCTVQWFLMCHTLCFGLPENPKHVRAMMTKSLGIHSSGYTVTNVSETGNGEQICGHRNKVTVKDASGGGKGSSYRVVGTDALHHALKAVHEDNLGAVEPANEDDDGKAIHNDLCIVAQDVDGNIHLYDARKREVQSMSLEVKILSDSRFMIA